MSKVRFYRVDGTFALVTRDERERRQRLQDAAAARAGRVIVRDRRGRPRSLSPTEAADARARQERARKAGRARARMPGTRGSDGGTLARPDGYETRIRVSSLVNLGALVKRVIDHERRHLKVAERNQRAGVVELVLSWSRGGVRIIPLAVFGPAVGYQPTGVGRGRTMMQLALTPPPTGRRGGDWRPQLHRAILLAAPSLVKTSTPPPGQTAPRPVSEARGDLRARVVDSPNPQAIPETLTAARVVSRYTQ